MYFPKEKLKKKLLNKLPRVSSVLSNIDSHSTFAMDNILFLNRSKCYSRSSYTPKFPWNLFFCYLIKCSCQWHLISNKNDSLTECKEYRFWMVVCEQINGLRYQWKQCLWYINDTEVSSHRNQEESNWPKQLLEQKKQHRVSCGLVFVEQCHKLANWES